MADARTRATIAAEIWKLRQQQLESSMTGVFFGRTAKEKASHEESAYRLDLLFMAWAALGEE
jgi:hypothetical protein